MNIKLNQGGSEKTFFKRNFVDVLDILTPKLYLEEDLSLSGIELSPIDNIIESHINLAKNFNSVFNISGVGKGAEFTSFSGVGQFFIKQNNLTNITTKEFEEKILSPLGKSLKDFNTSAEFRSYVEQTLLPNIRLNKPTYLFNLATQASAHDYLLNTLSWMYILNTSAQGNLAFQPSTLVANRIVDNIYYSDTVTLNEALKDVTTYIWKNYTTCSLFPSIRLIPTAFLSGTGRYVSGTQQLDKLHTLIDVIYSPLFADAKDTRVRDIFELYNSTNKFAKATVRAGPFSKFLRALSYSIYDIDDQVSRLNLLYDIDKCPEEYLPRIADLIGWELLGVDPNKWRMQLKNASTIYKAKGTKKALKLALDATFGETSFDVSSEITELYESYIPNLLYYCLATDCSALKDHSTWTLSKAIAAGVPTSSYSYTDMDHNIKTVVDSIIQEAYFSYPQNFSIGGVPYNPDTLYDYRGTVRNIPPWELVKYYRYCDLDVRMINFFEQRLLSLGVSPSLVSGFVSYIKQNTIQGSTTLSVKNGWLLFTSGVNYPPNRDSILRNFEKDKVKYLPLWNSKSSSFNLSLDASSFEFNTYAKSIFTSNGLKSLIRTIYEFTPAHAIPLVDLGISDQDTADYDESICNTVNYSLSSDLFSGSSIVAGYAKQSMQMSSLNRTFSRTDVDSLADTVFLNGSSISDLDRTNTRRRNYQNLINKSGWYDRTGFNMPGYYAASTTQNYNSYIPLGYIPSAGKFSQIATYQSFLFDRLSSITVPSVYDRCENLNSNNQYYGVYSSATFPIRGTSSINNNYCSRYATRSECDPIIPVIHKRLQKNTLDKANELIAASGYFGYDPSVYNVARILANSSIPVQPLDDNSFFNFEFGRGIHKLYNSLIKDFGFHSLTRGESRENGGFNLFSHTYGPLLYNGPLNVLGSALGAYPELLTTSYTLEKRLGLNNYNIFNANAAVSGTYIASSTSSLYVNKYEFRNPHILSGVELIVPSGVTDTDYFSIYKIDTSYETEDSEDFAVDNTVIKIRSKPSDGLTRVKFNLKTYGPNQNKFIPNHEFSLSLPYFVGKNISNLYGGGGIGVWIHTEPENGYIWSWSNKGIWEIDSVASLTKKRITENLSHYSTIPLQQVDLNTISTPSLQTGDTLLDIRNINSKFFKTLSLKFNTINNLITPPSYYNLSPHRLDQSYSVEVFMIPDPIGDSYVLFDSVDMIDNTLNNQTTGYKEDDLQKILIFFRENALGLGSRVAATTSAVYGVSGGSRINYRYHPFFGTHTYVAGHDSFSIVEITR